MGRPPRLTRRSLAAVAGAALFGGLACSRIEEQLHAWLAVAPLTGQATASDPGDPQRFFVLNIDAGQSRLVVEQAHNTTLAAPGVASPDGRGTAVTGQVVIDPADLSRTTGMFWADGLALRLRKVITTERTTLADLAHPNSSVRLAVTGDVTYQGETQPAQFDLVAMADISDGQLNGVKISTARPMHLPKEFGVSNQEPGAGGLGTGDGNVNFALVAKPGPAIAADVR